MSAQLGPDGIINLPNGYYTRVITGTATSSDNNYVRFARCLNGTGYCSSMGFSISGTTGNTVAGVVGVAFANHSRDGYINIQAKSFYAGIKIKMVSDGNQNFDLYVAVNTYQNYNIGMGYKVWTINGTVQSHYDAGTAYSTCYNTTDGGDGVFSTNTMPTGTGPTAY